MFGMSQINHAVRVNFGSDIKLGALLEELPPEMRKMDNDDVIAYLRSLNPLPAPDSVSSVHAPSLPNSSNSNSNIGLPTTVSATSQVTSVHRMKLMLIGYGNMGKTSLLHALMGQPFTDGRPGTDGVDVIDWKLPLPDAAPSSSRSIVFSCWDFAGQEEYYATHQLFLSDRCIYMLVWNPRVRKTTEGIDYWLKSIASFSNTAAVFLIASHQDDPLARTEFESQLDLYRARHPRFQLYYFNVSN
jgi:hypothetical protein